MEHFIEYIIQFLLGEQNQHLISEVAYIEKSSAAVVIIPSEFFSDNVYMTQSSMPKLPLKEIEGIPLLFGSEEITRKERQIVISADIIASTFFLISRYEECVNRTNRDRYGRMIGTKSLPYRAGFLMRPVVDEYGKLLRKWLRETGIHVEEPSAGYKHIYLTHDVDQIWQVRSLYCAFKTFAKRFVLCKKDMFESLKLWFAYEKYDEIYTFPWLAEVDERTIDYLGKEQCTIIYFMKGGGKSEFDTPYFKYIFRLKKLMRFLLASGATIGLHASFSAGKVPEKIIREKKNLEKISGEKIVWNRNHYLFSKNPEDMNFLISAGITDDFTMGYADTVGFRLGTCKTVKWINPFSKEVTSLTLHPLTIMEHTFSEEYMDLNEDTAESVIKEMLSITREFCGEVVVLWHNSTVTASKETYQRRLYEKTLEALKKLAD